MNVINYDSGSVGLVQYKEIDLSYTDLQSAVGDTGTYSKQILAVPAGKTVKILTENVQVNTGFAGGSTTLTITTDEATPTDMVTSVTETTPGAYGLSTVFVINGGISGCNVILKDVQASAKATAGNASASLMFVFVA